MNTGSEHKTSGRLTRRQVMHTTLATTTAAAVSMVPVPAPAEEGRDAQLRQLWVEFQAANEAYQKADDAMTIALAAAGDAWREPHHQKILGTLEDAQEKTIAAFHKPLERAARVPAESALGIAIKLRMWRDSEYEKDQWDDLPASATDDAERLFEDDLGTSAAAISIVPGSTEAKRIEDAALKKLWSKWLENTAAHSRTWRAYAQAERRLADELGPRPWKLRATYEPCAFPQDEDIATGTKFLLLQERDVQGEVEKRYVPVKGADTLAEAMRIGQALEKDERKDYDERRSALESKYRLTELEAAGDEAYDRLYETAEAIAEAPAEGAFGLAVKLIVSMCLDDDECRNTVTAHCHQRACEDACAIVGEDLLAQVAVAKTAQPETDVVGRTGTCP